MTGFLRWIRASLRTRGRRLEANAIEKARVAHEASELEKHREPELPAGRTNTDWTYIPPPNQQA